jgi:hypothetical protein
MKKTPLRSHLQPRSPPTFTTLMVALNLHVGRSLCELGWIITVWNVRHVVRLWARRHRIRNCWSSRIGVCRSSLSA